MAQINEAALAFTPKLTKRIKVPSRNPDLINMVSKDLWQITHHLKF